MFHKKHNYSAVDSTIVLHSWSLANIDNQHSEWLTDAFNTENNAWLKLDWQTSGVATLEQGR